MNERSFIVKFDP